MKKSSKAISIRTLIILSTSSIVFVASIILGLIVFTNWTNIMNQQASLFANQIEQQIHEKIDDFLFTPNHINETNQRFFLNGLFVMDDEETRERLFLEILEAHEEYIYSAAFATVDGYYYGASINENGNYQIMRKDATTNGVVEYYSATEDYVADTLIYTSEPYDPRLRDWYIDAVTLGEPSYSNVYKHFVLDELTITSTWPVYDDSDQLLGVFATHVLLSKIDHYLHDLMIETKGIAVIIENDSMYLIANSDEKSNFIINDNSMRFPATKP